MKNRLATFFLGTETHPRITDAGKLAVRLLFGLTLALRHGWPTTRTALAGGDPGFPDPLGLGPEVTMLLVGTVEFVFVLFVLFGFLTRLSALAVVVNFSVAVFIHHWADPFGHKELAFLYLSAMTTILLLGPGRFSVDNFLFGKKGD
ncbi:MAG: DoxX family protein [Balneolaceae bacterium]|nr:DoxX family protein [Balneolaceae bacterium]